MIAGIGTDIIEVKRMEEKMLHRDAFMRQVFSEGEMEYCEKQKLPAQHFAARFAAKEAFLKATGDGLTHSYALSEIEIITDTKGKPSIRLHNTFLALMQEREWKEIHVSLSHITDYATAFVIIEK